MKKGYYRANPRSAVQRLIKPPLTNMPEQFLDALAAEHQRFSKLLVLIEEQVALFHHGADPDYDLLRKIFFYLTHYPDRFHHPKEDLLFAKVAEHLPYASAPVEELHKQHRLIAESGALFLANVEAILGGTILPREAIEAPALEYIAHYRTHMDLEAETLLPLARLVLRPADWAHVNFTIEKRRDPAFKEPARDWYRALHRQISHVAGCGCAEEHLP